MSRRFFYMLFGVAVVLGGIFGFKAFMDQQIAEYFEEMPEPEATINAATVETDAWTPETRAIGSLEAVRGATLSFQSQGLVDRILFSSGTEVVEGETLVELDTALDRAELESLQAAAMLAESELQRARGLAERDSISDSELQRRQTEAEQARAAVRSQEERIRQKRLRAPFDGQLSIRQIDEGQFVGPGDPVVELQTLDPIHLNFTLPERRLSEVEPGQEVRIRTDAHDAVVTGVITAIEPRVRPASRMFRVQATLDNEDHRLRPGQFARVTLERGEAEEGLVVPQTAIRHAPWGQSAFVVFEDDDGQKRVEQRLVETGERRGDLIRIRDGLEEGDTVAASGLLKLQNDTPVNITEDARPDAERDPHPDTR
ncbi:efflux RND transporter periplasmic adaptor subunit [Thioalkalivibrio sp. ALE11]|uniref:efflux RND transporter periplasmic adaptor subunit n=1 Tax=Thioalkalivibrio sp. ALE11 TaxID=1265494 RepID=UPI0003781169|nr:efflux RND transporter periplasmic adaptor subunit [Thioalkalivibrio sp. ALE11]